MKLNDPEIPEETKAEIRDLARRLLRDAHAAGRFPTPIDDLVRTAKLTVDPQVSLDSGFLSRLARGVSEAVKRAVEKVIGVLDRRDRTIYLDQTAYKTRRTFVTIHELGHDYLPWQRDLYTLTEDSEITIDPEIQDQFEREASFFASEVLFQGDRFQKQSATRPLELRTAIDLSRRYGASCYATARRYAATNAHPCALVVLERPEGTLATGLTVRPRRVICSPPFLEKFGGLRLPDSFGAGDLFTGFALRKGFSGRQLIQLRRGEQSEDFLVEGFNTTYNVLVFLYPLSELGPRRVLLAS